MRRAAEMLAARLQLILVAALCVLAAVPFGRLFEGEAFLWRVGAGVIIAVVASAALAGRPPVLAILTSTAGLALFLVVVVFHHGLDPTGLRATWDGVTAGWSNLLTATVPTVATPTLVSVPVLLGFGAALLGSRIALATTASLWPALPALGVMVTALAFAGTRPPGTIAYPAAVVVVVLALVLARARPAKQAAMAGGAQARSSLLALVGVSAVAVAIGLVAPPGSTQSRYDLRSHYTPPVDLSNQITPLATVGQGLNDHSSAALFTVQFKGIPSGTPLDRVPIAILASYDGSVWGISAPFSLAGSDLPPGPTARVPAVMVTQMYHLHAYPSAFLPALERPTKVSGATLGFDRTTGMVVSPSGPGATMTYGVVSNLPQFTPALERRSLPGSDPTLATLVLPPPEGWPADMVDFAHRYGVGATPFDRLDALQKELRSRDFGYSTRARPGHTLGVLRIFLDPNASRADPNSRLGGSEQFAAAFAVLARIEGLPSRVVVGYRVNPTEAARGQQISVVAADIEAWAEVDLNGVGWVPFDPTNTTPRNPPPALSNPTTGVPATAVGPAKSVSPTKGKVHRKAASSAWGLLVLALIALVFPPLIVGVKRVRKARRRSRGSPADQILGAWLEARDQLRVRRLRVGRSTTLGEAARDCAEADRVDVADRIDDLQPLVDRALYAPEPPGDNEAKAAWALEDSIELALHKQDAPLERIRAELDPRALVSLRRPAD